MCNRGILIEKAKRMAGNSLPQSVNYGTETEWLASK